MDKEAFLFEAQQLAVKMDKLIDKYNVRDEVIFVMVMGVIETDYIEEMSNLKAIYSYNLNSEDELEEVLDFVTQTFAAEEAADDPDDIDISDLLDGLDISLN